MKIAHIAPPWITIPPRNYGGTEAVLYHLIEEQVAQGHDVTLFAPGDAQTSARLVSFYEKSLRDAGVPWQAHLKAYYHIHKAISYVKRHHFDIVHTHLSSSSDMYVYPLAASCETPFVTTLHSRFPFDRVESWSGDADDSYLEWLASVPMVAISESAQQEVPYPLNFVGVVHHGLPMNIYAPTVEGPEPFLVWLGRIVPDKGPHHAIQVAKQLGMPLVLAGIVDNSLREVVHYYEQMIKPHIDGEQIKYIGPVNQEQKIDLLSRASGFLNPIEWEEPFGMVMIEAMSVGCPVISFSRGAAPEIIADGKVGFLVNTFDEMVEATKRLPQIDRSVVRAHVEQHFSVRAMAEKYTSIYKRVIANSFLHSAFPRLPVTMVPPLFSSSRNAAKKDEVVLDIHPLS